MKKFSMVVSAVLMLIVCSFALSGCDKEHSHIVGNSYIVGLNTYLGYSSDSLVDNIVIANVTEYDIFCEDIENDIASNKMEHLGYKYNEIYFESSQLLAIKVSHSSSIDYINICGIIISGNEVTVTLDLVGPEPQNDDIVNTIMLIEINDENIETIKINVISLLN